FSCSRAPVAFPSFPTRRSSDLGNPVGLLLPRVDGLEYLPDTEPDDADGDQPDQREQRDRTPVGALADLDRGDRRPAPALGGWLRSEEHTSELQSRSELVCRLLL